MSDYTGYIVATYSISAVALVALALRSYMAMKRSERQVLALRQARKAESEG